MRKTSRSDWVAAAFDELPRGGIDALRVEPLAQKLGVTKGSFYHHFENRRALHLAVLGEWERLGTSAIIDGVVAGSDDPKAQLRELIGITFAPNAVGDGIEHGIRAWAATDQVAAEAAERVDSRRVAFVSSLLRRAGLTRAQADRRSRLLYRTLIGEFTWRSAGGPPSTSRDLDDLCELLLRTS